MLLKGLCKLNCPANYTKSFDSALNDSVCLPNKVAEALAEGVTLTLPLILPCSMLAGLLCLCSLSVKFCQHCRGNSKVLVFALLSSALAVP